MIRPVTWTGALVGLFSVLLITAVLPAQASAATGPLSVEGRNLVDPAGRVVILNGIFAVWKTGALRPVDDPESPNVFTDTDADAIREAGFDLVRLAWFWEGLEPNQGVYSDQYVEDLATAESKLAARGIYTLLDAHQDQYNRTFGDKPGFPDWTTLTNGFTPDPMPFPLGYFKAATGAAFSNLYANSKVNGEGIADAFGDAWKVVASRFAEAPMMVGYDLVNEPFPGTPTGMESDCTSPGGCPEYDRTIAQPFQEGLARAIRQVDPKRPVFFEPPFFFNSGSKNHFETPNGNLGPTGFSFHAQCSTHGIYQATGDESLIEKGHEVCPEQEIRIWNNAEESRGRIGGPMLMTEVTGTGNEDDQGLNCQLEKAEQFRTGFTFGMGPGRLRHADLLRPGAPFQRIVLSRVHPQATAGIPIRYRFDVRTGEFSMSYWADHSITEPTVIVVPKVQYSEDYLVEVTRGKVVSKPGADRLLIKPDRYAHRVSVDVSPASGDTTKRPSFPPCLLGPDPAPDPRPPAPNRSLDLRIKKAGPLRSRALLKTGRFNVTPVCRPECRIRVSLRLIGRNPRRSATVKTKGSRSLRANRPTRVSVSLNRKARKVLRRSRGVRLKLKVTGRSGPVAKTRGRSFRLR